MSQENEMEVKKLERWGEVVECTKERGDRLSAAALMMGGCLMCFMRTNPTSEGFGLHAVLLTELARAAHGEDGWDGDRFRKEAMNSLKMSNQEAKSLGL